MQPGNQPEAAWTYPSVGRWGVTVLPPGWMLVPGFGARQIGDNTQFVICNIGLSYDPLPQDKTLLEYIARQREMLLGKFPAAKFAGPQPVPFQNAEEAYMLLIRHAARDGVEMLHVQHYVRVADWIGVVTFTAPEQMLRTVRPDHELFLRGLRILPPQEEPAASGSKSFGQA